MRDVVGPGCDKTGVPIRPGESVEHPQSGLPRHDLTGGNVFVSTVLASAVPGSPNYDALNNQLLNQGAAVLTLDLSQGLGLDSAALLDGADRALQQLQRAATIQNLTYDSGSGALSFRIQNQTGHRLISGFPEGRRMFVNVKAYDSVGSLIYEVNPFDADAGTLKGLTQYSYNDPDATLPALPVPQALNATSETYVDELVYEMHPKSSLTGEDPLRPGRRTLQGQPHSPERLPHRRGGVPGFRSGLARGRKSRLLHLRGIRGRLRRRQPDHCLGRGWRGSHLELPNHEPRIHRIPPQ